MIHKMPVIIEQEPVKFREQFIRQYLPLRERILCPKKIFKKFYGKFFR
jgi:hypothetical protein